MRLLITTCALALFFYAPIAYPFAVDLKTNKTFLDLSRTASQAGVLAFDVNASDFDDASSETPMYLRITLGENHDTVVLAEELVYLAASPQDPVSQPINVPLFFYSPASGATITAPADAVQIVRWRKGEKRIWLRVNASSDTWVDNGPPTNDLRVGFAIGLAAYDSWQHLGTQWMNQRANLPGYVRHIPGGHYSQTDIVSVLMGIRTDQSDIQASPSSDEEATFLVANLISFDSKTFGVEIAINPDLIVLGNIIQPSFSADNPLAIGANQGPITESVTLTATNSSQANCPISEQNFAAASYDFNLNVMQDFDGETTQAVEIAVTAKLDTPSDDHLYFKVATDGQNNPLPGPIEGTYLLEPDAFTSTGSTVWQAFTPIADATEFVGNSKRVEGWASDRAVLWLETDANGELNRDFNLKAAPRIGFTGNVLLDYDVRVFSRGIEAFTDEAPFDRTFMQRQHFVSYSAFAESDVQLGTLTTCPFTVNDNALLTYMYTNVDTDQDGQISEAELAAVEVLNLEGLGVTSLNGLTSFPNLRQVFAATNFIDDFAGIQAWLDSASGEDITLDLRYNTIQDDAKICTALGQIETNINNLNGTLMINPQGNDRGFRLSLSRWGNPTISSVLDLVEAINAGGGLNQTYTICGD